MITGGGGSIGSEICRQVLNAKPKKIIIVDQSEYNLYQILSELNEINDLSQDNIEIVSHLENVCSKNGMRHLFEIHRPETIYHAAAYKHVPILEQNVFAAMQNNFIGTRNLVELASDFSAERFVLISTDKAVRPTNIMGASKRLAEMVIQSAAAKSKTTLFSMVRFGNVIGSSGSALPLFQKQIENGGPVTVTHPEITRFFMSIPEAATLVIEAGEMSEGGEMFVLDMGEQYKIIDIVRRMIRFAGKTEKTEQNPEGEISIKFIGLRPGEKMYEELAIGNNMRSTKNDLINMAREQFLSIEQLNEIERNIDQATSQKDPDIIFKTLSKHNILSQQV